MRTVQLGSEHKIDVKITAKGVKVDFYEYYTVCGWRKLSTEFFRDVETVEWCYGVEL